MTSRPIVTGKIIARVRARQAREARAREYDAYLRVRFPLLGWLLDRMERRSRKP